MRRPSEEVAAIEEELNHLSIKHQQLHDRYTILTMLRDFRQQSGQKLKDSREDVELEDLEKKLDILSATKKELTYRHERLNLPKQYKADPPVNHPPDVTKANDRPDCGICYVEAPPAMPAPKVYMDVEELPPYAAKTQCPYCHAFVTTEITHTVGPVTWLVCTMTALFGCVAGCCLIPFCVNNFKDIKHKCPKCRSFLHTITKL